MSDTDLNAFAGVVITGAPKLSPELPAFEATSVRADTPDDAATARRDVLRAKMIAAREKVATARAGGMMLDRGCDAVCDLIDALVESLNA